MTIYLSNRDGNGKTSEEGHYRLQTRFLKGFSLQAADLKVTQNGPLAMSVIVQLGDYRLENGTYSYTGWLSANEVVSIPTADSANPRISSVVLYVDKNATTTAIPPNNPGVTKLMVVSGSAASVPAAPTASAIQTAVGGTNPYYILANVTVPAASSTVTNAMITDARTNIGIIDDVLKASNLKAIVGDMLYPVGSVYVNTANANNPATIFGFGTWVAYGQGQVMVGIDSTQTEFTTIGQTGGGKTVTLTQGNLPSGITGDVVWHGQESGSFVNGISGVFGNSGLVANGNQYKTATANNGAGSRGLNFNLGGSSVPHNNLPPYVTVYMWRRTV